MLRAPRFVPATVVSVVDGDTVKLEAALGSQRGKDVDLGFHVYRRSNKLVIHDTFRLYGINAAEHGTPAGDAATEFLSHLLPVGCRVVAAVRQVAGHDDQEKYGRWLTGLAVVSGQTGIGSVPDVCALLVATGHAVWWDGKGERPDVHGE